jgi:hypothetical protein
MGIDLRQFRPGSFEGGHWVEGAGLAMLVARYAAHSGARGPDRYPGYAWEGCASFLGRAARRRGAVLGPLPARKA